MINDPAKSNSLPIEVLKAQCDAIFVCVPTPQSSNGACNTSILESVIAQLEGYTGIVIAKSTASPLVYQQLEATSGLKLAHVPEFLTQANAIADYLNPHKIVIGSSSSIATEVSDVIIRSKVTFNQKINYCSIGEAAFFKYMANTFLAMKVVMNNEYYDLAQQMNLNWEVLSGIAQYDTRLGDSHWRVPGPDGSRGFGGACFPKDTQALAYLAKDLGVDLAVLTAAIDKNQAYRI